MKKLLLILMALTLTACANMSEREKQTAWIVGGLLVVGAAVALSDDDKTVVVPPRCHFIIVGGKSTRICD